MVPAGNPSAVEAETGGSLGSLAIWYRLIDELQVSERPSSDDIPDGDTRGCPLTSLYMCPQHA